MLSMLFSRNSGELLALYGGCLLVARLSQIPFRFFIMRTLPFVPLFSFFMIVPALFSTVSPGTPVISTIVFSQTIAMTHEGIQTALFFFLRVLVAVSLSTLLTLTTPHHALLKALRILGLPKLFVMTLGMTYRYIFLLIETVQNSLTAVRSRVGIITKAKIGQNMVGMSIGNIWLRSFHLQQQTHLAMMARGYDGEPRMPTTRHATKAAWGLVLFSFFLLLGTLWLNQSSN